TDRPSSGGCVGFRPCTAASHANRSSTSYHSPKDIGPQVGRRDLPISGIGNLPRHQGTRSTEPGGYVVQVHRDGPYPLRKLVLGGFVWEPFQIKTEGHTLIHYPSTNLQFNSVSLMSVVRLATC